MHEQDHKWCHGKLRLNLARASVAGLMVIVSLVAGSVAIAQDVRPASVAAPIHSNAPTDGPTSPLVSPSISLGPSPSPVGTRDPFNRTPAADPVLPASTPQASAAPESSSSSAIAMLPHDLTPWSMFMQADIVVKTVMIGLAFASLLTWTIWLAKGLELVAAKQQARSAALKLQRADSLDEAARQVETGWTRRGPVYALIQAARRENTRSANLSVEGIKERLAIALSRVEARAGRDMGRGTGLLATIGATAPFVGLFGTVWGIMNSFIGISQAHTTNLAVVAPGIAEALLATAIGLIAAIPAVIIYNVFARSISGYRALLSDASGEVLQHVSRDLERRERAPDVPDPSAAPTGSRSGPIAMRPASVAAG
ncbi:tonB-system energizer ExbB [Bradyrhizobium sp. 2S1]|uniref:tonB-system energizer ExbB n=1 Tax=Bradyrhizobium sp. 2S1 TaxID=1404429 RepID=UPI0039C89C7C